MRKKNLVESGKSSVENGASLVSGSDDLSEDPFSKEVDLIDVRSDTNLARLAKQSSNHNLSSCADIPEELLSMRNS